jgi:(1->4)-alpha-D-glucan 1-alpha-D-glucosylmutase
MRPILATYRLQFHAGFRLEDARRLVPYLRKLGVTHLHASPLLAARTGSMHGYDVTDPTRLNPALGTLDDLSALVSALHEADMGLVLDIVPNHMAASTENPFWEDVLTYGASSQFARWFDIEWRAGDPATRPRVLLPVLGDLRVRVLARGELALALEDGRVRVRYHEHSWPVDPLTLAPLFDNAAEEWERTGQPGAALLREEARQLRRLVRRRAREPSAHAQMHDRATASARQIAALVSSDRTAHDALSRAVTGFAAGAEGQRRFRRLLDAQQYRLVYWRRAARELNYRRFFDVNELIALHMEDPEVFDRTHALVLSWREAGWVDGFRIDHPDGLLDPLGYLRRLADEAFDWRGDARYPLYAEKILSPGETLRVAWPVAGTTGYDFLNDAERVFLDPVGVREIEADYARLRRRPVRCLDAEHDGKRRALESGLSSGVRLVAARLLRLRHEGPMPPPGAVRRAIVEIITGLSVYRTYVDRHTPTGTPEDRSRLEAAVEAARSAGRASAPAIDLVADALLGGPRADAEQEQLRLRFVQRFQQLSGPAMAKGVEDTAFYACVPLLPLNEVGGSTSLGVEDPVAAFHGANELRARQWPGSMLAVTTHDTKRTADVRSRLDVLSEMPAEWEERVYRWRKWNRAHQRRTPSGSVPDVNTIYLLFQTLVGIWPVGQIVDDECRGSLRLRVREYMLKAVREAKLQTSWLDPDAEFEDGLTAYIDACLDPARSRRFLDDLAQFVGRVAHAGWWNALARQTLHFTAPGAPDLYQGDDLWNFALVDPDNRRPVQYDERIRALDDIQGRYASLSDRESLLDELLSRPADGRLKMHILSRALAARRGEPELFVGGEYLPLEIQGSRAGQVVAFGRRSERALSVTVVPRLAAASVGAGIPAGRAFWADTAIVLPDGFEGGPLVCAFDGHQARPLRGRLPVAEALARLPAALLMGTRR